MNQQIATHVSLENAAATMRDAGGFAWALGRLLHDVAEHDTASAMLTEAVIAGLAMGLQIVGTNLQDEAEQYRQLIENAEAAPQNADMPNRGAELPGSTLAERLLSAREAASLSQAELAFLVGISQAAISGVESGESKRTSYLPEIARACRVDIAWLAFGSEVAA